LLKNKKIEKIENKELINQMCYIVNYRSLIVADNNNLLNFSTVNDNNSLGSFTFSLKV